MKMVIHISFWFGLKGFFLLLAFCVNVLDYYFTNCSFFRTIENVLRESYNNAGGGNIEAQLECLGECKLNHSILL